MELRLDPPHFTHDPPPPKYVYMYICLCTMYSAVAIYVSHHLCVCLYMYTHAYIEISIYLSIYIYIYLFMIAIFPRKLYIHLQKHVTHPALCGCRIQKTLGSPKCQKKVPRSSHAMVPCSSHVFLQKPSKTRNHIERQKGFRA